MWKFEYPPQGWWDNEKNQKTYMKWLGELKSWYKPEDWYECSYETFKDNHGSWLIYNFLYSPQKVLSRILRKWNGANVCGGGCDECLAEVLILMDALKLSYHVLNKFIY